MSTIIIGSAVFLLMGFAIRSLIREKKQGGCSGSCQSCGTKCQH